MDRHARRTRLAAVCAALALLATAGYLMWLPGFVTEYVPQTESADPAAVFRLDRDALREDEMNQLRGIMTDETADEGLRAQAGERLMSLMKWRDEEAAIEEVLSARGFEAVTVSVHADSANVVLRGEELTGAQAAVVLELTARETGLRGGCIKVIPIK